MLVVLAAVADRDAAVAARTVIVAAAAAGTMSAGTAHWQDMAAGKYALPKWTAVKEA